MISILKDNGIKKIYEDISYMRYVQINMSAAAWADTVIFQKHRDIISKGDESWVFWGRGHHEQDQYMQRINTDFEIAFDWLETHLDGRAGFHSRRATKRLIAKLDEINPDVVHLHVLTGYYLNVEMLFEWLAAHHCQLNWTLHDCWAFTGHCIYFTFAKCNQWKTGCAYTMACSQKRGYPESWFSGDNCVRKNFERKRELFTMLPFERVQLITPSQWLADLVQQSYLNKYPVKVINNQVDRKIIMPTPSTFREQYALEGKFIVLGVASKWSGRKGLYDFIKLSNDLDSNKFAIVVIGLSKKQIKQVKKKAHNIIALPKTKSQMELMKIYSAADALFNPTVEDNYPTVNLEAEACGTPVITYNTGGCAETICMVESCVVTNYQSAVKVFKEMNKDN